MKIITTESGTKIAERLLMPPYPTFDDCQEDAAHYRLPSTGLDLSQAQAVETPRMGKVKDVDAVARAIVSLARRLFGADNQLTIEGFAEALARIWASDPPAIREARALRLAPVVAWLRAASTPKPWR